MAYNLTQNPEDRVKKTRDISTQIDIPPLNNYFNIRNKTTEDLSINLSDINSKKENRSEESVKNLITQKNLLNKDIHLMQQLITSYRKSIKDTECNLWEKCDHEWIYDEWANFDDLTKYLCKHCGCYRNSYWYTKR